MWMRCALALQRQACIPMSLDLDHGRSPHIHAAHSLPAPPPAHPVRRRSYLHLHEHSYGGSGGAVPYSAGAEEEGRHPLHSAPGAIPHAPRSVSIQGGIAPHGSGMVIRSARSQPALAAAVGDVATPPRGGGTAISQFELAQVVEERRGTAVHDPVSKGGGSSAIHPTAAHLPTAADACGGSIASLSGAATKWLCLFGLADRVVGIPHDSESPTAVATCAHVTLPLSDDEDSDSDGSVAAPTPHRMSQLPHALGVASNWAGFSPRPMPPTPRRVSPRGIAVNGIALNAAAPELVVYMGAPPAGSVDAATEFDAELHQGVLGARVLPPPRILCLQPRTLDAVLEAALQVRLPVQLGASGAYHDMLCTCGGSEVGKAWVACQHNAASMRVSLQIGTVAAARPEAVAAVDHLRARLRSVACVVANAGPKPHRPRVLLLSAADPLFSGTAPGLCARADSRPAPCEAMCLRCGGLHRPSCMRRVVLTIYVSPLPCLCSGLVGGRCRGTGGGSPCPAGARGAATRAGVEGGESVCACVGDWQRFSWRAPFMPWGPVVTLPLHARNGRC